MPAGRQRVGHVRTEQTHVHVIHQHEKDGESAQKIDAVQSSPTAGGVAELVTGMCQLCLTANPYTMQKRQMKLTLSRIGVAGVAAHP